MKAGRETPAPSSRTGCFRHESSCANFLADGPLAAAQRPNLVKTMDPPCPAHGPGVASPAGHQVARAFHSVGVAD